MAGAFDEADGRGGGAAGFGGLDRTGGRKGMETCLSKNPNINVVYTMLMGLNRARYLMLTGQVLNAKEAKDLGLVAEQLGDGVTHDVIGLRLEAVDLLAQGKDLGQAVGLVQQRHRRADLLAAGKAHLGQAHRFSHIIRFI